MSMTEPWRGPTLSLPAPVSTPPRRFALVCFAALVCALAGSLFANATALATNYKYNTHITGFPEPTGAASCGGNTYIADSEPGVVKEYSSSGAFVGQITGAAAGASEFTPIYLACAGGDIYVGNTGEKNVDEFSDNFAGTETYIGQITGAATGSPFVTLHGVGVSAHGVLYVVNTTGGKETTTTVDEFNDDLATTEKYTGEITGHGGENFGTISAVAVSPANDLYVANFGKNRVEEFTEPGGNPSSEPGAFVGQVTGLDTKAKSLKPNKGLAFDGSGNVLVADYTHKVIDIFKSTFGSGEEVVGEIGGEEVKNPEPENEGFGLLTGLTVNGSNGDVYVSDAGNAVVDVFNPEIQPTYKACVKAGKVNKKYTGKFIDKACAQPATKAQEEEGKSNKYELTDVVPPLKLKGKSATTVLDFYQGATLKYRVECKKDALAGEITGESTDAEVITYSKCTGKEEPSGTATSCGTITSQSLASQLVDESGKVYDRLVGKGTELAEFTCGSTTFKVGGFMLGEMGAEQINAASKSETVTFSPAEHSLSAEIGGTSGYTGGVEGTETQKGAALYIEVP